MSHYCKECQKDVVPIDDGGVQSCGMCGLQLDDLVLQSGPTFVQDGNFSHMAGTIIREEDLAREGGAIMGSGRDRSAQKGRQCIRSFAEALEIDEANTYIEQATRLYQLAMSTGFTRGRRVNQVAAACLYVVLRQDRKPYLLIDFCKHVSVNVYVLGSTYLRLTETLRLSTHPVQVCLLDPSLYIHRFANRLFPNDQQQSKKQIQSIISTSMHLIATMKRDWMQTGRRPAGVCGAALFLACHIHGVKVSRRDIIKIVSVGESTILHRIAELRNTASSQLTLAEFQENAKKAHEYQLELEENDNQQVAAAAIEGSVGRCRHVHNNRAEPLAFGLCQDCYKSYVRASGGNVLGAEDPPAFKRNLRRELKDLKRAANNDAIRLLTGAHPSSLQEAAATVQRPPQPLLCLPSTSALPCNEDTNRVCEPEAGTMMLLESGEAAQEENEEILATTAAQPSAKPVRRSRLAALKRRTPDVPDDINENSGIDEDFDASEEDADEHESESKACTTVKKRKGRRRKNAAKKKPNKLDPSLEAEFALAMIENSSLREIVDLLKISRAELPAMSAEEARHLLAESTDPLAEAHAKRAQELESIAEAKKESRADDATLLRVAKFLEVQNGTDLELVSEPLARVITDDMQERARDMEQQNAEMCTFQMRGGRKAKSKSINISLHGAVDGGADEGAEVVDAEDGQDAVTLDVAADGLLTEGTAGELAVNLGENLSDLDDSELDQYLCTEEEVKMKEQIWMISNKDWLEAQEAKKAAAAAVAEDDAPKKRKKPKKPTIQFKQGATAQESVERMLESKNLKSRVNQEMLEEFFKSAEKISNGETVAENPPEEAEPTAVAQHIKGQREGLTTKQNAQIDKHQAALMREQAAAGGDLGSLLGSIGSGGPRAPSRVKKPFRLGRL